jgi:diguanylate cyclase (GGDEF)-like protein/PAS domain S-box-containing protein
LNIESEVTRDGPHRYSRLTIRALVCVLVALACAAWVGRTLSAAAISSLLAALLALAMQVRFIRGTRAAAHGPDVSDSDDPDNTATKLRRIGSLLSQVGELAGIGAWEINLQGSQEVYWSDQMRRIHDVPADFIPSIEKALLFYRPEHRESLRKALDESIATGKPWDVEMPLITATGREIYARSVGEGVFDRSGKLVRITGAFQNISERKALEEKEAATRQDLELQTATLQAVIDSIPAMVAVWDIDFRYRLVNRAFERWRGMRRDDLIGRSLQEVEGDTEYPRSLHWMTRVLTGETVTWEKEYPGQGESKHVSMTYIPLRLRDGSISGFVQVAQDITAHRQEHVRLMLLSEHDQLTGLLNRIGLEKFLRNKSEQGVGATLALLYIDLDHFKPINDTYGHASGDAVLREFAARLQCIVRPTDAVARLGGDEFGIVLLDVKDPESAARVADKVVEMARRPIVVSGVEMKIGASVGLAFDADADGGWIGLLSRADALAYQAKANGRGRAALATQPISRAPPSYRGVR